MYQPAGPSTPRRKRYTNHYLVHTSFTHRPFYTRFFFIAEDLKRWGYRVDTYPARSLWIKEHFKLEQRAQPILLWATEAIARHEESDDEDSPAETRGCEDDIGRVLQDFVKGLVRFNSPSYEYPKCLFNTARLAGMGYPAPPNTPPVLTFYIHLLSLMGIKRDVPGPCMALPHSGRLDCLTLELQAYRDYWRKDLLLKAMQFAVEARPGRMAELRDPTLFLRDFQREDRDPTKLTLRLWVRAYNQGREVGNEEDEQEALPLYETDEEAVEGQPPPSYNEVVVQEPL